MMERASAKAVWRHTRGLLRPVRKLYLGAGTAVMPPGARRFTGRDGGSGTRRLQPIWIEDMAEYYARSLELPEAAGRTFEVGGPDAPTWNEFWDRLKRVLGARRPSLHVPVGLLRVQAALTERLPGAPVTRDQLTMLELADNVVTTPDAVETFQLPLVPLDEQLRRAAT